MDVRKRIAQLVQEACIREVCAPKPGNVDRYHDFSDTAFEDFLLSAVAIGPAFENASNASVGRIVWQATEASRRIVRSNTNLGIILLLAPLAKACLTATEHFSTKGFAGAGKIQQSLHSLMHSLTVEDARLIYDAIRAVNPGGLGRVPQQDIAEEPSLSLLEVMELAKDRDSIASEYVTDFEITYEIGLPALRESLSRGLDFSGAVVQAFLTILNRVPDTLIARKNGVDTSLKVSQWARDVLTHGGIYSPQGQEKLLELDNVLRDGSHQLNPGTTADLTAASIFLALIEMEV